MAERLWSKVDRSGGPDACWPFTGATNGKGYGILARGGDSTGVPPYYAHRLALAIDKGVDYDQLTDEETRHGCHNRPCCNPRHLSGGTSADNKHDSIAADSMYWQHAARDAAGRFLPRQQQETA